MENLTNWLTIGRERRNPDERRLFVWKWASNNVPGIPKEIVAVVNERRQPAALDWFNPSAFLDELDAKLQATRKSQSLLIVVSESVVINGRAFCVLTRMFSENVDQSIASIGGTAANHGLTVYDVTSGCLAKGSLPKRFRCDRENRPTIYDPQWTTVSELLGGLEVRKGDPYLILGNHKGDYVQTYVCDGKYAVEWRVFHDRTWKNYTHLCAGHQPPILRMVHHGTAAKHITVFASELLSREEAEGIFRAFYSGGQPPAEFAWRDMTEQLGSVK